MINVTELRNGVIFEEDGNLLQVLTYEHVKTGRGSGNIKVKVRNIKTGATVEKSFITGARVQDVALEKKKASYLYEDGNNVVFMDGETYDQFEIPKILVGDPAKYLKEGMVVTILMHDNEALTVELPNSVEFTVRDAGANFKGDSVSNVWKKITLENGVEVDAPMFIKDGERIKVDTRTGKYVERVK